MGGMALFDTWKQAQVVNDALPLHASILSHRIVRNHAEYMIRVEQCPGDTWTVTRRYRDFLRLRQSLNVSNVPLILPPKKLIGNLDQDFLLERQKALQDFLDEILGHPWLSLSFEVKHFLDPQRYSSSIQEVCIAHVATLIRNEPNLVIGESVPNLGWRSGRTHFFVTKKDRPGQKFLLSWVQHGPDRIPQGRDLSDLVSMIRDLQHPWIQSVTHADASDQGFLVVRPWCEGGTLRDRICGVHPKMHFLKKYAKAKESHPLPEADIRTLGRQILEALQFLRQRGIPYGHLHSGNVMIEGEVARLSDVENGPLGLSSFYRSYALAHKRIDSLEALDAYAFGHLLYEMAFGSSLLPHITCDTFPPCSPVIKSTLERLLTTEAVKKRGMPSLGDLLSLPLFRDLTFSVISVPRLKLPKSLAARLLQCQDSQEKRLCADGKAVRQQKKRNHLMQPVICIMNPVLQSQERELSERKGDVSMSASESSSTGTVSPPPPPPMPRPLISTDPVREGTPELAMDRAALLHSIVNFKPSGLKHTVTQDRSGPVL